MLMCQRGKEPHKGEWTFPGGSLELGESVADGAARELREETGLEVGGALAPPRPVTATDAITLDADGRVQFHYLLVQMACTLADPLQAPVAADDALATAWLSVPGMLGEGEGCLPGAPSPSPGPFVVHASCIPVVSEAAERFGASVLR